LQRTALMDRIPGLPGAHPSSSRILAPRAQKNSSEGHEVEAILDMDLKITAATSIIIDQILVSMMAGKMTARIGQARKEMLNKRVSLYK